MATEFKPRRVRDESERKSFTSEYLTLDEGESFLGVALFDGDPKEDEPGYYEYFEHWDTQAPRGGSSVPCAGEDCPLCEDGDRPRNRAKTLWLVQEHNGTKLGPKGAGEVRIFNLNGPTIKQFTEIRAEGEKIKGRVFRIRRADDRGTYVILPKQDSIKVADVKAALTDAADLEALIVAQGKRAMQRYAVAAALADDDDDDGPEDADEGETKVQSRKGTQKVAAKEEPEETEGWPAEVSDLEVTVGKVNKKQNTMTIDHDEYGEGESIYGTDQIDLSDLEAGQTVTIDYYTDDEQDKVLNSLEVAEAEAEAEEEDAPGELPDEIDNEEFVVTEVNEKASTIDVQNEDLGLEFTLYFLDTMEIDFDDYPEGAKVKVTAEKDNEGDMVATAVPEVVKEKKATTKGGAKAGAKKGG